VPLSRTRAELLFEVFNQHYQRGSILVATNLPFDEWTEVFGSERLTSALPDHLTHHVYILETNHESYLLRGSRQGIAAGPALDQSAAGQRPADANVGTSSMRGPHPGHGRGEFSTSRGHRDGFRPPVPRRWDRTLG